MAIRYPPTNRTICQCGRCPRCRSHLTDNFSDDECKAYLWLLDKDVGGWFVNNQSTRICLADGTHMGLLEFARSKGWEG